MKTLEDWGFPTYADHYAAQIPTGGVIDMADKTDKASDDKGPKETYKAGAVSVSVFENVNKGKDDIAFTTLSFNVQRAYTEDDGKTWKHTSSFKLNDVPKLISMLQKAYEEAVRKTDKGAGDEE